MFQRRKAFFLILIIAVLLVTAGMIWLRSYLFSSIAIGLDKKIDSLRVSGLTITYDSISVDWMKNVIEINGVLVQRNAYDTTCIYPEFIRIGTVRATGMRLFPLVLRSMFSIKELHLDDAHMVMRPNSLFRLDSASMKRNEFAFRADRISVKSAHVEYLDSATCERIIGFKTDFLADAVSMDFGAGHPMAWQAGRMRFDSLQVRVLDNPSTYEVRHIDADLSRNALNIDTIRLIPDFGKTEYGRRFGYEVDRIEGTIPFIRARGLRLDMTDSLKISASTLEVQFYLTVYRDKRLPFRREHKDLPTTRLRHLPFGLAFDSLRVARSYVQYDERRSDSPTPGRVYFDDLEALFLNVSNNPKSEMKLEAQALLMGDGKVTLSAVFPVGGNKHASMRGSLRDFTISKINSMLTPAANLKVESGTMDNLRFDFLYSSRESSGEIELNYRDLKLAMFKEEEKTKGKGREKDNFRSFMLNTFVFKKNMNGNVPEEKRKGTVGYVRDDSRSVFNFWMNSILSGIKSAYDLDKKAAKKSKHELKQEERLVRREARKARKAKSKDRG
jgi:hypothetical protein